MQNLSANKISGFREDKVQFFSSAHSVFHEEELMSILTDPQYAGDMLFLLPSSAKSLGDQAGHPRRDAMSLSANERIKLPYTVTEFNSNHIEISADVPIGEKTAWLFYSDTWHSGWKANVNGQPVPVLRANIAYKAVPLQPGRNVIRFNFHSTFLAMLYGFLALNSLFWLVLVFYLLGKTFTEKPLNNGDQSNTMVKSS